MFFLLLVDVVSRSLALSLSFLIHLLIVGLVLLVSLVGASIVHLVNVTAVKCSVCKLMSNVTPRQLGKLKTKKCCEKD